MSPIVPSVVHPVRFKIKGIIFEIVSYARLTDEQARKIVLLYYRGHSFKKSDQGKQIRVVTLFDENSAGSI